MSKYDYTGLANQTRIDLYMDCGTSNIVIRYYQQIVYLK